MECGTDPGWAHGWWTFYLTVLGSIVLLVVSCCLMGVLVALAKVAMDDLDR